MINNNLLYIDPGSGSYLVQVIIAAVLAGWFWIKNYWTRIKAFFSSKKKDDAEGQGS